MKKTFVIIGISIAVMLLCLGWYLNWQVDNPKTPLTDEYVRENHCMQAVVWLPIATFLGLSMVLRPSFFAQVGMSLRLFLPQDSKNLIFLYRLYTISSFIFGLILLILSLQGVWIDCKWVLDTL